MCCTCANKYGKRREGRKAALERVIAWARPGENKLSVNRQLETGQWLTV